MREIGLFPLPLVLMPGEELPLHIFEPRYRELIEECLDTQTEFGLLLEDNEVLYEVGTLATASDVLERYDDGRLDIVITGGERFVVSELMDTRSFQTGTIEIYVDEESAQDEGDTERYSDSFVLLRR